jgi:hypothetical protein
MLNREAFLVAKSNQEINQYESFFGSQLNACHTDEPPEAA